MVIRMKFWKDHVALRVLLMIAFFIIGIVLLIVGWRMTGELAGLGLMVVGVIFLVTTFMLYNKPFETPKEKDENAGGKSL